MEAPKFSLDDVKYADRAEMFLRAKNLYETGKVRNLSELGRGYAAKVRGTHLYEVSISNRHVDEGYCTCPMGERDMLCKHMLAVALAVLDKTGGLSQSPPPTNLTEAKRRASAGMRKLRSYNGPSRIWFSYQRTLSTGAGMIADAVAGLPATREHAEYLWKLVRRLSNKLATSGIDDSDGVVGGCISELVQQVGRYAHEKPELKTRILTYCDDDTGFGFEDELRALLKK